MYLTREEEKMLNGEYGEATRKAMKLIVRVGEALGAERLVEISHAHASGISYDNIRDAGLEFMRDMLQGGGRARVYATYNPVGMEVWDGAPLDPVLRLDPVFRAKQAEIIRILEAMGFKRSITCIPYRMREPRPGEHLAWGESSAVAVANTLYGARTNREGGPIALAAALTGRTYLWGLHLPENRRPRVLLRLEGAQGPLREPQAGVLGYMLGEAFGNRVAYVDAAIDAPRGVQALCAAAAAAGSTGMCIVRGVSPEDNGPPREPEDKLTITMRDVEAKAQEIAPADPAEADLFFTGCPHHGPEAAQHALHILQRLGGGRLCKPVWIAVPGYEAPRLRSLAARLAERNIHLLPGTCLVVSRLRGVADTVATDSVKTAFYLPRRHGVSVALTSLEEFIRRNIC
jgi:predicted aconitase